MRSGNDGGAKCRVIEDVRGVRKRKLQPDNPGAGGSLCFWHCCLCLPVPQYG